MSSTGSSCELLPVIFVGANARARTPDLLFTNYLPGYFSR